MKQLILKRNGNQWVMRKKNSIFLLNYQKKSKLKGKLKKMKKRLKKKLKKKPKKKLKKKRMKKVKIMIKN